MEIFSEYLSKISDKSQREKLESLFDWIDNNFPMLEKRIAWNQPMYTDHGTYIIGFSASKKHFSVGLEKTTIDVLKKNIIDAGYETTKMLFKIKWNDEIDFELIEKIISFNIEDKKQVQTFWK
ncbi:MAG: iron chaperone [Anaerovoracaceae bacterium]